MHKYKVGQRIIWTYQGKSSHGFINQIDYGINVSLGLGYAVKLDRPHNPHNTYSDVYMAFELELKPELDCIEDGKVTRA